MSKKHLNLTRIDIEDMRKTANDICKFIERASELITDYSETVRDTIRNNTKFEYKMLEDGIGFTLEMEMRIITNLNAISLKVPLTSISHEKFEEIFTNLRQTGKLRASDYRKIENIKPDNVNYGEIEYLKSVYNNIYGFLSDYERFGGM